MISMLYASLSALVLFITASSASATGKAEPWQFGFQEAASPIAARLSEFHDLLLVVIFSISIFVAALMVYVCLRYRRSVNPNPSKNSHNMRLEFIWIAVPFIIVCMLVVPSFKVLYYVDGEVEADMTLKVVGNQWYWGYQYPDNGDIAFDSYMLKEDELKEGDLRLLSVDNPVVLPINTTVRIQLTAADVIHAWAVPSLGIKRDAVPGRLNETWVLIDKPGTYYGQCSELCGYGHGFMPIEIKAVTKEEFAKWVESQKNG
jgi:cytochrome c oxidase subunit 2